MKLSQAKEYLPFVQAAAEGKTIQFHGNSNSDTDWTDLECEVYFDYPASEYRIKPEEPKFRPWKPEEVPVGALIKRIGYLPVYILQGYNESGISIPIFNFFSQCVNFRDALESYQYSTDHGKTWHPCGMLE